MRTALVTGATGYIGANLTKKLIELDWAVGVIKRPNSSLDRLEDCKQEVELFEYDGSVESLKQSMIGFKPEVIFHLASNVVIRHKCEDVDNLIQSNILFGTQLLEVMHLYGVEKMVNTSTSWQTPEGTEYKPYSLYAALKQAFEGILQFYANVYGIKSISLRLPDVYGPNDSRSKILNLVQRAAQNGEQLRMSAGEQEMDLLYIDDVVDGFIKASELIEKTKQKFSVYALSSGKPLPLKKIVEMYEGANAASVNIDWGALSYRENEIMKVIVPDNILPSWKSNIALEMGMKKLMLGTISPGRSECVRGLTERPS